jgi:drug/metabolite transporter (DMT)-like permease
MIASSQTADFVPRPVVGILLALLAFALFTAMDTAIKLLGGRYHVIQVMWLNSFFGLLVVLGIAAARGGIARLRTRRPGLHLLRWAISFSGAALVFYAYVRLPLADVYAVLFTSPLLITALSVPLLGERVGWRRWTAIGVGFLGVVVMLRPGTGAVEPLAALVLLGALAHAINMIIVRRLGQTEPAETFGVYGNMLSILAAGAALPWLWITPTLPDLALAAFAGSIAGGGFFLLAEAFRHAPAAVVAPFQYSQMPYGIAVGWLMFGTAPDAWMMAGAAIVIASGLYILQREAALVAAARRTVPRP